MPTRRSDTMRAVDAVMPLVDEFNLLDEGDKLTFLDLVDPLPEKHDRRPKKKASKKSSKSQSSSKSPRASGIQAQLKERRQEQREPMTTKDDNYDPEAERCAFVRGDGKLCYLLSEHNVHHMKTHPEYHEFQSGKSDAPSASASSSANGGAGSTTANSETQPEDVGTVAHGASGGD